MTPDDKWFADCDKVCARAGFDLLLSRVNPVRQVKSITAAEFTPVARAIVDTWIVEQSKRPEMQAPYAAPPPHWWV